MAETGKPAEVEKKERLEHTNQAPASDESSELVYILLGERNELVHQLEQALSKCATLENALASRVEDVAAIPPEVSNDGISLEEEEILQHIEPSTSPTANAQTELANNRFAEENAVLRQQLAEAKKERDALQLEAANNQKAKASDSIRNLISVILASAYQDMEALRAKRDEQAAEISLLKDQVATAVEEAKVAKETSHLKEAQVSDLEKQIEGSRNLRADLEILKAEILKVKQELEESNKTKQDFKNSIGLKDEECQRLNSDLALSAKQSAQAKEEISRLDNKTKSLTDVVDSKEKQIEELMRERDELRNQQSFHTEKIV